MQLGQLQKIEAEIIEMGYQLIAISPDRPEKLKESIGKNQVNYTLLSDSPMIAARAFGLAFRVNDETVERYKRFGIDLEGASGEKHHLLPVPAAYVVTTDGVIHFEYVNPDYRVRVHPEVLLAAAKAILKK